MVWLRLVLVTIEYRDYIHHYYPSNHIILFIFFNMISLEKINVNNTTNVKQQQCETSKTK
ncbi:hypothetical protein DERP_002979 [Dermatophagoides pteronyssinus]|uniref:Uncharacterized protein n=1 Tax=Dermatophagoides pteronyssinus TaxID=6956 RepID=A0ABQ8JW77_DERPT|nr:hypothetical protein DERP_002979 [Dermatophagoides pteronyssinus]